jgi:hypothetical protein
MISNNSAVPHLVSTCEVLFLEFYHFTLKKNMAEMRLSNGVRLSVPALFYGTRWAKETHPDDYKTYRYKATITEVGSKDGNDPNEVTFCHDGESVEYVMTRRQALKHAKEYLQQAADKRKQSSQKKSAASSSSSSSSSSTVAVPAVSQKLVLKAAAVASAAAAVVESDDDETKHMERFRVVMASPSETSTDEEPSSGDLDSDSGLSSDEEAKLIDHDFPAGSLDWQDAEEDRPQKLPTFAGLFWLLFFRFAPSVGMETPQTLHIYFSNFHDFFSTFSLSKN